MRRSSVFALACALAFAGAWAYTPVRHDGSYTTNGVTYAQRGGLGSADYVVTNIDANAVGKVKSVNGKTGDVSLDASDVGAATAAQGAKADAALSRAEAKAGYTRWMILRDGVDVTAQVQQPTEDPVEAWVFIVTGSILDGDTVDGDYAAASSDVSLDWTANNFQVTYVATRTRLPTMADIAAATNGIPRITPSDDSEGWAANATRAIYANEAQLAARASDADNAGNAYALGNRSAPGIIEQLDAAASTNDVQLTPVYGGNGQRFSDWACEPAEGYEGATITLHFEPFDGTWQPYRNGDPCGAPRGTPESTTLTWDAEDGDIESDVGFLTATRTENPTIGYTLGSQTNKVLASTNNLARASDLSSVRAQLDAATATNAAQSAELASHSSQLSQLSLRTNDWNTAAAKADTAIQSLEPATNYTDSAIANADTSYRRVYSITNLNQTVQYIELDPSHTNLAIELPTTGDTKDWLVYVYAAADTTLSLPSGVTWWTSDAANTNAIEAATPTALYFSQISTNIFMFGRQTLESVGGAL